MTRATLRGHVADERRRAWHASHLATVLVLAWGALAFGAVYSWAYWPLAAGCLLCGGAALVRRAGPSRLPNHRSAFGLATIAAAVAVQLIPLPVDLLARLSPAASGIVSELDIAFAAGAVDRHPLSIAPGATLTALVLYGALAVLMLGVARSVSATGPRRLAALVAGLGVILALIGIVQRPLYEGRVYGLWTPLMPASPFGPFINKNHFAGWMLMALPVTFGLLCATIARAMPSRDLDWRRRLLRLSHPEANRVLLVGAAAAVMSLSLMLTLSRSGIVAFVLALSLTTWSAIRHLPAGKGRIVVAGYSACLVLAVVGWTGVDAVAARFGEANPATINERLPIWRDTWRIVREFGLAGTGLNTYGVSTLFYQTSVPAFHLREAHNDYLQLAAEGGLLLGVPIVVTMTVIARQIRQQFAASRGSSYWIRLGAVTGLVAIALQSAVEFSLQMPANAALCAVLLGIALHRDPRSGHEHRPRGIRSPAVAASVEPGIGFDRATGARR
jgi:O-antigen ligase